jgi:hypothetical protein
MPRLAALVLATALATTSTRPASAQPPAAPRAADAGPEVRLTVFRNPATGIEVKQARLAVFVGFYPTILRLNPEEPQKTTTWMRAGVTVYAQPTGPTVYATLSGMWSLQSGWRHGLLTELGARAPMGDRVAGRLGAAVLTTFDGRVRLNPTVGLDVRLSGGR